MSISFQDRRTNLQLLEAAGLEPENIMELRIKPGQLSHRQKSTPQQGTADLLVADVVSAAGR